MDFWYKNTALAYFLYPLSLLYRLIAFLRRKLITVQKLPVPCIVVGNVTVGGTGKTPFVIALARVLQQTGYRPGIITRGYRGKNRAWPARVGPEDDPYLFGDEAVLLAIKTACPVVAGKDRVAAARYLLATEACDILLSDDGLQHYALGRDIEIAVVDGRRRFGNGFCLPAGPLREMPSRLSTIDWVFCNGEPQAGEYRMSFVVDDIVNLLVPNYFFDPQKTKRVMAISGVGDPQRFFDQLRGLGIVCETRAFPDHHAFTQQELQACDADALLLTEKDAVKCARFKDPRCFVVRGHLEIEAEALTHLLSLVAAQSSADRP